MITNLSEIYASVRSACDRVGGQEKWAKSVGVSPQYVSDLLNARRDPGPKILTALGYVRRVTYVRSNHA